ncbi:hypothetical protein PNK_1189 [Candidatus Protochlamydia naegleriophila]|uniref:DUF2878 domain-containing protein n=1 Tax=Candidatus Protochlamydia naegleriophila TaxID=389348 RepID=A0A0U5JGD1_9BACT|nr:DUF2878 domain-containing protein [Candidatus Protochlamydia naegleriophila]CUI16806.1 hypothetical protein PNK_1189 [Candidatus Protochlamydia naegleriophila]
MQFLSFDRVFSTALFYGGWCWCLNDVALGRPLYGLGSVFAIIIYQLYRSSHPKADFSLLIVVSLLGPLSDILYSYLGLLNYHTPFHSIPWLPPLWIFLLWGLVAVNIPLFSWMHKKWFLAPMLGAIGGPFSYLSAVRLGGASLLKPLPLTFIVIGGMWAIFLPTLMWLSERFKVWFKG